MIIEDNHDATGAPEGRRNVVPGLDDDVDDDDDDDAGDAVTTKTGESSHFSSVFSRSRPKVKATHQERRRDFGRRRRRRKKKQVP